MCKLCSIEGRDAGIVYVTTTDNRPPENFILLDDKPRRFGETVKWPCYCRCQSVAGKKAKAEGKAA